MTLEEIEERVKHALEALNSPDELYDWRLTHYNSGAWANLQEGCYFASDESPQEEKIADVTIKELIKAFRDRSVISHIDFHIKVPEPGKDEFRRMSLLFGLKPDVRLLPPRDEGDRRSYRELKTLEAMRLTIEHKQIVSEKLRQQFTYLMVRTPIKPPELLAVHLKLEGYNPYQKKLSSAPNVNLRNHFVPIEKTVNQAPAPAEPMFGPSSVDNSSFEARLLPTRSQAKRQPTKSPWADTYIPSKEPMPIEVTYTPPTEIHEEFATYCQNLYEKAKGN